MPYIKKDERAWIDSAMRGIMNAMETNVSLSGHSLNPGQMNYIITKIVHKFIELEGLRYNTINDAIGVIECVKQELYRMVAAPYENKKILENGNISSLDVD